MKTKKLSILLFGAVLFLGLGSFTATAQSIKCGAEKCGASMSSTVIKDEKKKDDVKKSDTKEHVSEFEIYQRYNRQYHKDEYQRGTIRTH